jgi:hypothetical protein
MLTEGSRQVVVVDDSDAPIGVLSIERVSDLLRSDV